jgi:hypothetical protein
MNPHAPWLIKRYRLTPAIINRIGGTGRQPSPHPRLRGGAGLLPPWRATQEERGPKIYVRTLFLTFYGSSPHSRQAHIREVPRETYLGHRPHLPFSILLGLGYHMVITRSYGSVGHFISRPHSLHVGWLTHMHAPPMQNTAQSMRVRQH